MSDKQNILGLNANMPDPSKLANNLKNVVEQSQQLVQEFIKGQAKDSFQIPDPNVVARAFAEMTQKLLADPQKLMQAQMSFWQDFAQLMQNATQKAMGHEVEPFIKPELGDKRFKADDWAENAVFDFIKQSYLLTARTIGGVVRDIEGLDPKTAERADFYTRQFIDAISPSNFVVTNPVVLKHTLETGGENLVKGLQNMLGDLKRGKGRLKISMTDLEAFEPGKNVASTPGKVVYQNELMQLLQYEPTTEKVFKRPLLIVPPWINKYYIMDLRPKNSWIKYCVDQGFTVFVISWVNPDEKLAEKTFDDYLQHGPLKALEAIEQATGEKEVVAQAYCIGGTLLLCTLAYLAAKGREPIKAATFFTTMSDFADPGELSVFIDEEQLQHIEKRMEEKGYLEGEHMANVFNMLRSNDLIWSFVINNYLMGKDPFPFDLLYWNSDATRMPRAMHTFYLRNMYQHNRLREPGGISLLGESIDLGKIKTPCYFLSTKEDHIAPWKSTYAGTQLVGGPVKFVLGGSGHIAGVINPASSRKYGYWTNSELPANPDEWLAGAEQNEGSWWPDWLKWMKRYLRAQVPARTPGDAGLSVLEDAPGSYVKNRLH